MTLQCNILLPFPSQPLHPPQVDLFARLRGRAEGVIDRWRLTFTLHLVDRHHSVYTRCMDRHPPDQFTRLLRLNPCSFFCLARGKKDLIKIPERIASLACECLFPLWEIFYYLIPPTLSASGSLHSPTLAFHFSGLPFPPPLITVHHDMQILVKIGHPIYGPPMACK